MKQFLIRCVYDYWCQGWETSDTLFLVYADSYEEACTKIRDQAPRMLGPLEVKEYRDFENHTIE